MKLSFSKIVDRIQTAFPNAPIEYVIMLSDSIVQYRNDLPKMTRKKPYKAKDIITILKHN